MRAEDLDVVAMDEEGGGIGYTEQPEHRAFVVMFDGESGWGRPAYGGEVFVDREGTTYVARERQWEVV